LKLLLAAAVVALTTMMFNPPEIRGWWIFEYVETSGHMVFSAIWGAAHGAYIAGQISLARFIPMLLLGMALHATARHMELRNPE